MVFVCVGEGHSAINDLYMCRHSSCIGLLRNSAQIFYSITADSEVITSGVHLWFGTDIRLDIMCDWRIMLWKGLRESLLDKCSVDGEEI